MAFHHQALTFGVSLLQDLCVEVTPETCRGSGGLAALLELGVALWHGGTLRRGLWGWQHLGKPSLAMARQEKPKHVDISVSGWFLFWVVSVSGSFLFLDSSIFWIVFVSGSVLSLDPCFWII